MGSWLLYLLQIANRVSKMGRARTIIGIKIKKAFPLFNTHKAPTEANMKPAKVLPESPKNILAGYKLNLKKANMLPARAIDTRLRVSKFCLKPKIRKATRAIRETPQANPSKPSIRLMELVMPTIQKIKIG